MVPKERSRPQTNGVVPNAAGVFILQPAALKITETSLALSLSKGEQVVRLSSRCPSMLRQAQHEREIVYASTFAGL